MLFLNRPIALSNLFWMILVLILLAVIIFFGYQYSLLKEELGATKRILGTRQINEKILNFTTLFIEKVLKAETEVDFETRLKLENAVRDLKDKEILDQWKKFTESQTENEAQENVKDLLELLIKKIKAD